MLAAFWSAPERILRIVALPLLRLLAAVFWVLVVSPAAQAQNIVGMFGDASGALRIRLSAPAPAGGLAATVGLSCADAAGVTIGGAEGEEALNFTVAYGADPVSAADDAIVSCARLWAVRFVAGAVEASFAPAVAESAAGRLLEFFLADPAGGGSLAVSDAARYIAAARGLIVSWAARSAVLVEGQSATITVSFSGAVNFPAAAAAVRVAAGESDAGSADYQLGGLRGGGLAAAAGAREGSFVLAAASDDENERAGVGEAPHERVVLTLADSRGSGFAVGSPATLTVLIVEPGDHSPIEFTPARVEAIEGENVTVSLSFNALPVGFSVTLAGA